MEGAVAPAVAQQNVVGLFKFKEDTANLGRTHVYSR